LLWAGLRLDPHKLPSALIDKPAPKFQLPVLNHDLQMLSQQDLLGHFSLLNVWASWCQSCRQEHALLMKLSQRNDIVIFGLNYKDKAHEASQWLRRYGDPYRKVGVDRQGKVGIDWGVYGTPETFVLNQQGIIVYKQIGPLTNEVWLQKIKPLLNS